MKGNPNFKSWQEKSRQVCQVAKDYLPSKKTKGIQCDRNQ